jgi:small subunit ribosomal protein S6
MPETATTITRSTRPCPTAGLRLGRIHREVLLAMRAYELMIIVDADVDDAGFRQVVAKTTEQIEAEGGRVVTTDLWGRRRFAYEINHKHEGIYAVLQIATEASNLDTVDRSLRLADEVVRHKIIRLPDREAAKRGLLGSEASPAAAG